MREAISLPVRALWRFSGSGVREYCEASDAVVGSPFLVGGFAILSRLSVTHSAKQWALASTLQLLFDGREAFYSPLSMGSLVVDGQVGIESVHFQLLSYHACRRVQAMLDHDPDAIEGECPFVCVVLDIVPEVTTQSPKESHDGRHQ